MSPRDWRSMGWVCTLALVFGLGTAPAAWADCPPEWLYGPGQEPPGTNDTVRATTTWDPDGPGPEPEQLVVGGYFTTAGGVSANYIARWNGATWQPLGSGMNSDVLALTVYNGELVVGGWFTTAGGRVSAYWARWGPVLGACCFADGHCDRLGEAECTAAGGTYQGDNTACDPNPCPQPPDTGACCFADGSCQVETAADCATAGGTYQGDGTVCDPNPCPQPPETGACCDPDDGSCTVTTEAECTGVWHSEWANCTVADCPLPAETGACCFADGSCQLKTAADCATASGTYQGDDTVCVPNPCPQPPDTGACCFADGSCLIETAANCGTSGGTYQGNDTVCVPNPCPQPPDVGACCFADGHCEVVSDAACTTAGGNYQGTGTVCVPNPCPQPPDTGACCFADGSCLIETAADCGTSGGTYQGNDTVCVPNPCPQPPDVGACCFADGHCEQLTQTSCTTASGTYEGDDTACTPNPCPQPPATGACCYQGGDCQTKTAAQCSAAGGDYQGDNISCSTANCPQPSCAYELTLAIRGEGTVSASPSRDTYDCDASVHLTATPDECWHFARWTGDLTGTTNPASLTMNEDHSITAVFEADRYTLEVTVEGEGSVSLDPAGGTYDCGTAVRLTATAEPCWHFVRWEDDASGAAAEKSLVMDQDLRVTAVFEPDPRTPEQCTLTVTIEGEGTVDPAGGTYEAGTTVELTATPSSGWHFVRWQGDASGTDAASSVVMSEDRNVTAVFEQDEPGQSDGSGDASDEQDTAAQPERQAPGACGGLCPAASGGLIGLMLAGLLRRRTAPGRRIPADRV